MKKYSVHLLWAILMLGACSGPGLFGPQSAHRKYADGLSKAGLANSTMGKKWLEAAEKCLYDSTTVTIPYRESGFFAANIPQSVCVNFKPKRGQKITITIDTRPSKGILFFAELWSAPEENRGPRLLAVADSTLRIEYEQDDNRMLLLRIQPELLVSVSYSLTIIADPTLAFPVPGNDGTRIGSFWGDARDGGKRSHEGIDIFDKFRTPVIAPCNGTVTRVNENGLGGKCVWLNPAGKSYMLYYAHLDSQIAKPLQQVKTGDTLGLMGNTGNAKNTPPHLHFGIYANGAIDPLPFVQQVGRTPDPITGDTTQLSTTMRTLSKSADLLQSPARRSASVAVLAPHTSITPEGATGNYYRITLPDGKTGFLPVQSVNLMNRPLKKFITARKTDLLAEADRDKAVMKVLEAETLVESYAVFNEYTLVRSSNGFGWLHSDHIRQVK